VFVGEYTGADGEDLNGLKYFAIKVPFSKAKQLKLKSTRLPVDEDVLLSVVEDPQHDCWNPFAVFCFYVTKCHPRAKKFYACIVKTGSNEQKKLQTEFGKEIWFAESGLGPNWNMGPSKHRELCRDIARLSGVEKHEDCAGHSLRAACITHCICQGLASADVAAKVRHASLNSQLSYAQGNKKRKANRLAVMNPSGELATKKSKPALLKKKSENVELSENKPVKKTQPFKPENQVHFERLTRDVEVPAFAAAENKAIVKHSEEKENESPEQCLKRLEFENKCLKLAQENARLKQELSIEVAPSRHSHHHASYPPSHVSRRPLGGQSVSSFGYQDIEGGYQDRVYPRNNYRESHPPCPAHSPPPPCHPQQRHSPFDDDFGEGYGDYHRRHY